MEGVFDVNTALTKLIQAEPNNKFYESLQKQYQKQHGFTHKQMQCIKWDFDKKIKNSGNSNNQVKETNKLNINRVEKHSEIVFSITKKVKDFFTKEQVETTQHFLRWREKNPNVRKTLFIENMLTYDSIYFSPETLKTLIEGYEKLSYDDAWYTGVKEIGASGGYVIKNIPILFCVYGWGCGGEQWTNTESLYAYHLNQHGSIDKYWIEMKRKGNTYSIPDFQTAMKNFVTSEIKNTGGDDMEITVKTKSVINKTAGDVLVDSRERSKDELEKMFGEISYFKAVELYNNYKISMKEYESIVKNMGGMRCDG